MATKLPRRTVSMSKRMVGKAKAPTLGDRPDTDAEEPDADATEEEATLLAPAYSTFHMVLGCLGMAGIILTVVVTMGVLFGEEESSYSMLPDGYREEVGLGAEEQTILDAILGDDEPTRSPFPEPRARDPIILEVDCPDGTVQIATGPQPADTVCIKGRLIDDEPLPVATVPTVIVVPPSGATIGGQTVPPLTCAEDEVIGYVGIPDTLVCIHADNVGEGEGEGEGTVPPPMQPRSLPDTGYGR